MNKKKSAQQIIMFIIKSTWVLEKGKLNIKRSHLENTHPHMNT